MPISQNPSLQVVNKYKKDIIDLAQPQKLSVQLVKLEVVVTQRVRVATLGCIKMHQAIQHVLSVQVVLATKLPVLPDAMLYLPDPIVGVAKFKNVHRVTTAKEKQKTKQLVSQDVTQQW